MFRLYVFTLVAGCVHAVYPTPSSLWISSLGYKATMAKIGGASSTYSSTDFSLGNTLLSQDGKTIYVAEAYLRTSDDSNASPRFLALDAATGARLWTFSPTIFQIPVDGFNRYIGSIFLSADSSTVFFLMISVEFKIFVYAFQAGSGTLLWGPISPSPGDFRNLPGSSNPFNAFLPALSASGDLCLEFYDGNSMVSCLVAATGATRFSFPINTVQDGLSRVIGLDSLRKYFVLVRSSSYITYTTNFEVYGTSTGALLWNLQGTR